MPETVDDIKPEIATAFGLYAMSDATLHEAASEAGITRWELENAIEDAGFAEYFGLDTDGDVAGEIDDLLDEHS